MAAVGWMEAGEAVVGWMGSGDAVVDCMGPGLPVVGWMEMGEPVVLHSTTMTAGVPLVRWQPVGLVSSLADQRPINAPLVGVERPRGIE